ncbi:MAG: helix-turn-helix domain-containing protein, partial [Planctomycetes bacterium]|nr:helix-turn-helix domain-containing protein [Planctomycetota bacterium]
MGSVGIPKEVPSKPYATECRGAVLAACDRGRSTREVATRFNVSESWVRRVKQERP